MTTTSERTMTPDGQIANPLDKAANREPFVEWFCLYPALAFAKVHENRFDVHCAQLDTLLRAK